MKRKYRRFYLLPENLDYLTLVSENPPIFRTGRKFKIEELLTVITLLYEVNSRKRDVLVTYDFTYLKLEYLRKEVPNAEYYLKYLQELRVIECDDTYIIGVKSKGYKFTNQFIGTPVKYSLNKAVNDNKDVFEYLGFNRESNKIKHLYKWFNENLKFNISGALKEAVASYWKLDGEKLPIFYDDIDFSSTAVIGFNRRSEEFPSPLQKEMFNKMISGVYVPLSTYESGMFWFKVDESGYRLHTNITNLRKSLRKHISYNGCRLVSFDIKNSQPFFFNVLLSRSFWEKDISSGRIHFSNLRGRLGTLGGLGIRNLSKHTLTMRTFFETQYSTTFELFKNLTLSGNLYEFILEKHLLETGESLQRDKVKKQLLSLFYDKKRQYRAYEYDIESTLNKHLPGLLKFCEYFKPKTNHAQFATLLQCIESTVVLRLITRNIAIKCPKMPLFTIHDSIATTEDFAPILGPLIASEIESVTGFRPIVKEEPWY